MLLRLLGALELERDGLFNLVRGAEAKPDGRDGVAAFLQYLLDLGDEGRECETEIRKTEVTLLANPQVNSKTHAYFTENAPSSYSAYLPIQALNTQNPTTG